MGEKGTAHPYIVTEMQSEETKNRGSPRFFSMHFRGFCQTCQNMDMISGTIFFDKTLALIMWLLYNRIDLTNYGENME